jgi:hypothetical protein
MANFNSSLNKLKEQLNNSKNINIMNKPKKSNFLQPINFKNLPVKKMTSSNAKILKKKIIKKIQPKIAKPIKSKIIKPFKPQLTKPQLTKSQLTKPQLIKPQLIKPDIEESSFLMDVIYGILLLAVIGLTGYLGYLLYQAYIERQNDNIISSKIEEAPDEIIEDPKGAEIKDKDGVNIKVEKGGDITENTYLTKYGSENSIVPNQYERQFFPISDNLKDTKPISNSDNGSTKKYYNKVKDYECAKMNDYIKEQNEYVRRVNERIREINSSRINSPEYVDDQIRLKAVREYERVLANKVKRESNPYLENIYDY